MRLRPVLLASAVAAVLGSAALAAPALAAPAASAPASVSASFVRAADAESAVWYLKPTSALHLPTAQGSAYSGRIASGSVPAGTYVLQVQNVMEDFGGTYASRTIRLHAGQHLALGLLEATHAPLTLHGRGPKGGTVTDDFTGWNAQGERVAVGGDGRYALPGLVPGTYTITAQKRGYADRAFRVWVQEPVADVFVGRRLR